VDRDPLVLQGRAKAGSLHPMLVQHVLDAVDAETFPVGVGEQHVSVPVWRLA